MAKLQNEAAKTIVGATVIDDILVLTALAFTQHNNQSLMIQIHDNGPGVVKEKVDHLFKKRFTTKSKGHGIGLVTCKRIVDSHNGRIRYNYDNGALFSVELPLHNSNKAIEELALLESVS